MVFQTIINFVRSRGPDEFWRKRRIFKLSSHFVGRRRNVYNVAIRNVHRSLQYTTKARPLKKQDMKDLWDVRITAGCEQFGISMPAFKEALYRNDVLLNRKALADLSVWEPKTFESLVKLARLRASEQAIYGICEPKVDNKVYIYNPEAERK